MPARVAGGVHRCSVALGHPRLGKGRHARMTGHRAAHDVHRQRRARALTQPQPKAQQRCLAQSRQQGPMRPLSALMPGHAVIKRPVNTLRQTGRRRAADEPVQHDGDALHPGRRDRPRHRCNLAPAQAHEHVQPISGLGSVTGNPLSHDSRLGHQRRIIHAGATPGPLCRVTAVQGAGKRCRRGRIANPHLAHGKKVGLGQNGVPPGSQGLQTLGLGQGRAGGEIRCGPVQRQRMNIQPRACRLGQLIDRRPPGLKIQHHLRRNLRRKSRNTARCNTVVSGKNDHLRRADPGLSIAPPARIPLRHILKPSQSTRRLGQLTVPLSSSSGRIHMRLRGLRQTGTELGKRREIGSHLGLIALDLDCVFNQPDKGHNPLRGIAMAKHDTRPPRLMDLPVALVLLTRLPLPPLPRAAFDDQARAAWAFPLVGLVVNGLAALTGLAAMALGLPVMAAAGLVLAVQVVATGVMHEDGLADLADGFWGGMTRERRLEIMQDSLIGAYGVTALILSLGLRWSALVVLLPGGIAPILAAGLLSRAALPLLMTALPQARPGGLSASVGTPGPARAATAIMLALAGAFALIGPPAALVAFCIALNLMALTAITLRKIGGQTGDVLGAAQQISEITALLCFAAL